MCCAGKRACSRSRPCFAQVDVLTCALIVLILGTAFAAASTSSPRRDLHSSSPGAQLRLDDFVIVTPSARSRLPLVHAARHFRAGVRTFIPVESVALAEELNASPAARRFRETYAYYPGE